MQKIISALAVIFVFLAQPVVANEELNLQSANVNLEDKGAIVRGAKHFVTYCLGCHSIKHIRYQRFAKDFNLDEKKVLADIAPLGATIYDKMLTAMNAHDSEKWFGIQPPDLSLVARSRNADWLYTYLKSFYKDTKKPLGSNNLLFKDVGMPNVLWQLQGEQTPVYETITDNGKTHEIITGLKLEKSGELNEAQFDTMISELVSFLAYVGEPAQVERERMGKYVLLYLIIFTFIAYRLKKEYWKDVH